MFYQPHTPSLRMVRGVQAVSIYDLADLAEPIMTQPAAKDWQTIPWPISFTKDGHVEWTGTGLIVKDGMVLEVECS